MASWCLPDNTYMLDLPIYAIILSDFTRVAWPMDQLWLFCVNKMTTTTVNNLRIRGTWFQYAFSDRSLIAFKPA